MTIMTIALDDATELDQQSWLAPIPRHSIPLVVREINLGDARDAGRLFGQIEKPILGFYGFNPIAAGGTAVTNELVNEMREELGI